MSQTPEHRHIKKFNTLLKADHWSGENSYWREIFRHIQSTFVVLLNRNNRLKAEIDSINKRVKTLETALKNQDRFKK